MLKQKEQEAGNSEICATARVMQLKENHLKGMEQVEIPLQMCYA